MASLSGGAVAHAAACFAICALGAFTCVMSTSICEAEMHELESEAGLFTKLKFAAHVPMQLCIPSITKTTDLR